MKNGKEKTPLGQKTFDKTSFSQVISLSSSLDPQFHLFTTFEKQ